MGRKSPGVGVSDDVLITGVYDVNAFYQTHSLHHDSCVGSVVSLTDQGVPEMHTKRGIARLVLLAALFCSLGTRPVDAQNVTPPDRVQCYDLALSPWQGPDDSEPYALLYAPPPRIRLDTTRADDNSSGYRLSEPPGALPSVHEFRSWRRAASGDALMLGWSTGTAGLSARLDMTERGWNDTLRGRAKTFVDVGGAPRYTADITAVPVDCDSPLPPVHRSQRSIPIGVALVGGDSVTLGAPLADVPGTEPVANRYMKRLRRALDAPFRGASDIELLPDRDGDIAIIRFQLPEETDFEALVDTLTALHGPPTDRTINQHGGLRTHDVLWQNRTVKLGIHRACSLDGPCDISVVLARQRYRTPHAVR